MIKKISLLLIVTLSLLISCKSEDSTNKQSQKAPLKILKIEGFYKDAENGLSFFKVESQGNNYTISNSQGQLKGIRKDNKIFGKTAHNDSFSFEKFEDHAIYSILGITIKYVDATQAEYEKSLQPLEENSEENAKSNKASDSSKTTEPTK